MQTSRLSRVLAALTLVALASCSRNADNPYAAISNPPLLQGRLHAVTLVTDSGAAAEELNKKGYTPMRFASNYPASTPVEASIWSVPESVAAAPMHFKAPSAGDVDIRVLQMPLAAKGREAEAAVETAFYRNVLGTDPPAWPAALERSDKVRVQVWTYFVSDVKGASKHLRENGIPVVYDPVAITTAYLGDHKTMAIRAPDGIIVELVETMSR